MSDQEPPSKGYVVRDRRRFEADGTPRESGADVVQLQTGKAQEPRPALRPAPATPRPPEPPRAAPEPPRAAPRAPEPPRAAPEQPRAAPSSAGPAASSASARARRAEDELDFSQLVLSLATNAVVALEGGGGDGRVPGGRPNLALAEQNINILLILEEKTRGNLTAEEQELLQSVLYDLRMQYVAIAQGR